jgi:hypothetical protein
MSMISMPFQEYLPKFILLPVICRATSPDLPKFIFQMVTYVTRRCHDMVSLFKSDTVVGRQRRVRNGPKGDGIRRSSAVGSGL